MILFLLFLNAAPPNRDATPEQARMDRSMGQLNARATALWGSGKHKEALAARREGLALSRRLWGDHPLTASWLAGVAHFEREAGSRAEAVRLYREEERLWERLYGPGHWKASDARVEAEAAARVLTAARRKKSAEATRLYERAGGMVDGGKYREAIPLYREALALREEALGAKDLDTAACVGNLAHALQHAGELEEPLPLLRRALAVQRERRGARHPDVAMAMNNLAELHKARAEYDQALPLLRGALAIQRAAHGERHADVALALNNLATLLSDLGDHRAALPMHERALAIRAEVLGRRHDEYAQSLHNLAALRMDLGECVTAQALLEEALAVRKALFGERHPNTIVTLHNLAALHRTRGDARTALPLYEKAALLSRAGLGEKHPLYAASLSQMAGLHLSLGDHASALPLAVKAAAVKKAALGARHPEYARAVQSLATLRQAMGDAEAAGPLFKESLAIRKAALGERHPDYASALNGLGGWHVHINEAEEALPLHEEALRIRKATQGERHPDYTVGLNMLGSALQAAGRHRDALPLGLEALHLIAAAEGRRHPRYAAVLHNLACLHQGVGRPSAAVLLSEQALRLKHAELDAVASLQGERQRLDTLATARPMLDTRLSLAGDDPAGPYRHVLSWKGAAYTLARQRRLFAAQRDDPAAAAAAERLRETSALLAALHAAPAAPGTAAARRERLEALTREAERYEAELSRLSERFREGRTRPTPAALAAALPEGAALIDFLHFIRNDHTRAKHDARYVPSFAAFILRRGAAPVRVDLGPAAPVEKAVAAWRAGLVRGGGGAEGAVLRRLVWAPLEEHLKGAGPVLVSPDGALGRLPWAALPGSKAGSYLIEEVPLAAVPIPQAVPELLEPPAGARSLLVVGGVDFGKGTTWQDLPGTSAEARAVAERFGGRAVPLSGEAATKEALRAALPKARFAHLATHGFFAPPGRRSALRPRPPAEGTAGHHPGLLSGLVLAGANHSFDGTLTALEIAELDLSRVELAVLSACETGLGRLADGEGLLGLQRAFAVAGCKSVISSLWSVDDAATSVLMERFYLHLWGKKRGKLEALRQAQIDVLRHPQWVEEQGRRLLASAGASVRRARGLGEAVDVVVEGKKERRSPPAWWAAWQLSGDWR